MGLIRLEDQAEPQQDRRGARAPGAPHQEWDVYCVHPADTLLSNAIDGRGAPFEITQREVFHPEETIDEGYIRVCISLRPRSEVRHAVNIRDEFKRLGLMGSKLPCGCTIDWTVVHTFSIPE